jgi:hypothetical protein
MVLVRLVVLVQARRLMGSLMVRRQQVASGCQLIIEARGRWRRRDGLLLMLWMLMMVVEVRMMMVVDRLLCLLLLLLLLLLLHVDGQIVL